MNVRAIPTLYDGELFRSRLEIRWKIFFESLGIESTDEPGTHCLISGNYIPDLWLPECEMFVEIKSHGNELSPDDPIRYKELADATGSLVMRVKGYPAPGRYAVRLFVPRRMLSRYPKLYWANFAEAGGELFLIEGGRMVALKAAVRENCQEKFGAAKLSDGKIQMLPLKHSPAITAAMQNARRQIFTECHSVYESATSVDNRA